MIENREMAEFARNLWENYIKVRNHEADANTVSFYKAQVTAKPGGGVLTIKRPFDTTQYNVAAPSYMDDISVGGQVLVLRFGNDNNLSNHFVIDNAARTMLASAIATGSSITFPISISNGGTNATTLAGAKANLGIPEASDVNPLMDGTASAGNLSTYSRGNHRHPSDTTKADKTSTVTNVGYDSATGNITQTINGTTTNVAGIVTPSQLNAVADTVPASASYSDGSYVFENEDGDELFRLVTQETGGGASAFYAVCDTQSGYALTATTTGSETFALETGANVFVKFTYDRPEYPQSFFLTLNVDSTGAKTIYYSGSTLNSTSIIVPTQWLAGDVVQFVYDGTYWQMIGMFRGATTSRYGITLLSSATNSTSTSMAATPSAVKAAYDLANGKSTVTLNGTVNTAPSFYAPTTAGTSGYILQSNGSGEPSWVTMPEEITVDSALSPTSANPVQNKVIYDEIQFILTALESCSEVTFTRALTSGTEIGTITIDGVATKMYAPTSNTYGLSMASNVITLTGQDGSTSSVTLPVYNGSVS